MSESSDRIARDKGYLVFCFTRSVMNPNATEKDYTKTMDESVRYVAKTAGDAWTAFWQDHPEWGDAIQGAGRPNIRVAQEHEVVIA